MRKHNFCQEEPRLPFVAPRAALKQVARNAQRHRPAGAAAAASAAAAVHCRAHQRRDEAAICACGRHLWLCIRSSTAAAGALPVHGGSCIGTSWHLLLLGPLLSSLCCRVCPRSSSNQRGLHLLQACQRSRRRLPHGRVCEQLVAPPGRRGGQRGHAGGSKQAGPVLHARKVWCGGGGVWQCN